MDDAPTKLWSTLQNAQCVDDLASLPKQPLYPPWYLAILQGVAGWVAALFLFAFLGSFLTFMFGNLIEEGSLLFGLVFIAIGLWLERKASPQQVFLSQLGFVFGISGLLAMGWWLSDVLGFTNEQDLLVGLLIILLVHSLLTHHSLNLFLNGIGMTICLIWLLYLWHLPSLIPVTLLLLTCLLHVPILRFTSHYKRLKIFVYALLSWGLLVQPHLSLFLGEVGLFQDSLTQLSLKAWVLPWLLSLLVSGYLILAILKQRKVVLTSRLGIACVISWGIVGAIAIPLSGLSSAMLFILLGLQLRDKLMTALAIFSIPLFISAYYYSLNVSLLEKSLLLTALGLLLLLARWGLSRYLPTPCEPHVKEAL